MSLIQDTMTLTLEVVISCVSVGLAVKIGTGSIDGAMVGTLVA